LGTTAEQLYGLFEGFGPIEYCDFVTKADENSNDKLALVAYKEASSAAFALMLDKYELETGRILRVEPAIPEKIVGRLEDLVFRRGLADLIVLLVQNILNDVTAIELRKLLGKYGPILHFNHIVKPTYKTSIAFVTFKDPSNAIRLLHEKNIELNGNKLVITMTENKKTKPDVVKNYDIPSFPNLLRKPDLSGSKLGDQTSGTNMTPQRLSKIPFGTPNAPIPNLYKLSPYLGKNQVPHHKQAVPYPMQSDTCSINERSSEMNKMMVSEEGRNGHHEEQCYECLMDPLPVYSNENSRRCPHVQSQFNSSLQNNQIQVLDQDVNLENEIFFYQDYLDKSMQETYTEPIINKSALNNLNDADAKSSNTRDLRDQQTPVKRSGFEWNKVIPYEQKESQCIP
jgi:RNA recognition motif-containing protein